MKIRIINSGDIFGRLIVIGKVNDYINKSDGMHRKRYLCQCICKDRNTVIVSGRDLVSGHVKSCGCYRRDINSNSPMPVYTPDNIEIYHTLLISYYKMISESKINSNTTFLFDKTPVYKPWLDYDNGPKQFYDDMLPLYTNGYDMIIHDANQGYIPSNIEWKDPVEIGCKYKNGLIFE